MANRHGSPHLVRPGPNGNPTSANGWYRTVFAATTKPTGERTYLFFEGAATILDVHVNGRFIGQHRGAFTAAVFDVTDALAANGKNLLAVRVSNDRKECADCLPSTQDGSVQLYNPYGGLNRKVWLVTTPAAHIFPEMASSGVFIRQQTVNASRADLSIRTAVLAPAAASLTVRHLVRDVGGKTVATFTGTVAARAGQPVSATVDEITADIMPGVDRALATARRCAITGTDLHGAEQRLQVRVCEVGPFLALKLRAFYHRQ